MSRIKYELWDMVSYGDGEPLMPFTKIASNTEFDVVYHKFTEEIKARPCVIVANDTTPTPKIYESPDGGETIYEREFGDYDPKNRREVTMEKIRGELR
jgi:hypothetical protein